MSSNHPHHHLILDLLILALCLPNVNCQVTYTWTNEPSDIYIQPCNSAQLDFNWTFSPSTPDPVLIAWSKQTAGGTFVDIATFAGGTFTPSGGYVGRLSRTGSTAEIQLSSPTSDDDGVYRVIVSNSAGQQIESTTTVFNVTTATLDSSGITATCVDNRVVNCTGVTLLGIPPATITLSYGSTSKTNSGSELTVTSDELSTQENVTCTISGPATVCLDSSKTSASVQCGLSDDSTYPAVSTALSTTGSAAEGIAAGVVYSKVEEVSHPHGFIGIGSIGLLIGIICVIFAALVQLGPPLTIVAVVFTTVCCVLGIAILSFGIHKHYTKGGEQKSGEETVAMNKKEEGNTKKQDEEKKKKEEKKNGEGDEKKKGDEITQDEKKPLSDPPPAHV